MLYTMNKTCVKWVVLASKMPLTATLMWIGSLAIIGFPFFSGYYSKESILETAYFNNSGIGLYAYIVGIITALLTAFYSWRLLLMTFHGNSNLSQDILDKVKESPKVMIVPLIFLAFGSMFSGLILYDIFIGSEKDNFWFGSIVISHEHLEHLPFIQNLIIKSSVAFGVFIAGFIYFYNKKLSHDLANYFSPLYSISINKWYVDELYDRIFTKPLFFLASFFWKRGDQKSIDAFGPDGITKIIKLLSKGASRLQSGFLYHYVFVMLIGLVTILSWFVYY